MNAITNDVGGVRPLAVFLIKDNLKENVNIDVRYGFERNKHSPVMVKIVVVMFIWDKPNCFIVSN